MTQSALFRQAKRENVDWQLDNKPGTRTAMVDLDRYVSADEMNALQRDGKGRIEYDARGNAVFVPFVKVMDRQDMEELLRDRSLALTVDDAAGANDNIPANPQGLRKGYDPYASGLLNRREHKPKKDLRALSQWIQQRKLADDR